MPVGVTVIPVFEALDLVDGALGVRLQHLHLLLLILLEGRLLDGRLNVGLLLRLLLKLHLRLRGWLLWLELWGRTLRLHLARCLRHL